MLRRLHIVVDELAFKHEQMRTAPFPFLRATFYRWAQNFAEVCPKEARAPEVLAVGDLHVENFGTWRDGEGRLIWGINDFDEAWRLPYTNDLVRLTTSALIAGMTSRAADAAEAILEGYCKSLESGGQPFALAERHAVLRHMAVARLHEPERFWDKLNASQEVRMCRRARSRRLQERCRRADSSGGCCAAGAGLGSLGRERYVAVAHWRGGLVAREAKASAPSAAAWAAKHFGNDPTHYQELLDRAIRCPDPFVRVQKKWIVRRLAPDCSRIELSAMPRERDEIRLLRAMGWETANVHLGSAGAKAILADLRVAWRGWLLDSAHKMEKAVLADFAAQ